MSDAMQRPRPRALPSREPHPKDAAGRVPPHDLDCEAAVLSACLLSAQAISLMIDFLKPEHFYSDANGKIFAAILALTLDGKPVDSTTVASYLRDRNQLAHVGGASYLAQITDATPAVAHVRAHGAVVLEKARRRWIIAACQHMAAIGYGEEGHTDPAYIDRVVGTISRVAQLGTKSTAITAREAVRASLNKLAAASARGGRVTGISTGKAGIDRMTGGLMPAEVTLVCADTKHGKSSLARSIAAHVASTPSAVEALVEMLVDKIDPETGQQKQVVQKVEQPLKQGVAIFSAEMSAEEVMDNVICELACVSYRRMRSGQLDEDEMRRVIEWASWVENLPIRVIESRAVTAAEMRGHLGLMREDFAKEHTMLALCIVDTVQLMAEADQLLPGENEERRLNRTGKLIGDIAVEFQIPILALSQLNAQGITQGAKALEQHAHAKWVIHVDGIEEPMHKRPDPLNATVSLKRHRFNPPDDALMHFYRAHTHFEDRPHDS